MMFITSSAPLKDLQEGIMRKRDPKKVMTKKTKLFE
jgi:hypothetical protein